MLISNDLTWHRLPPQNICRHDRSCLRNFGSQFPQVLIECICMHSFYFYFIFIFYLRACSLDAHRSKRSDSPTGRPQVTSVQGSGKSTETLTEMYSLCSSPSSTSHIEVYCPFSFKKPVVFEHLTVRCWKVTSLKFGGRSEKVIPDEFCK